LPHLLFVAVLEQLQLYGLLFGEAEAAFTVGVGGARDCSRPSLSSSRESQEAAFELGFVERLRAGNDARGALGRRERRNVDGRLRLDGAGGPARLRSAAASSWPVGVRGPPRAGAARPPGGRPRSGLSDFLSGLWLRRDMVLAKRSPK